MAKIFSAPDNIKPPVFDYKDLVKSKNDENRYINEVKEYCKKNGDGELVGEFVSIPHADGKAMYIIANERPLELVHLDIGDAWDSPHADLLNLKQVRKMVNANKALFKLFSQKKCNFIQ